MDDSDGGRIGRDTLHLALPIAVGQTRSPTLWHFLTVSLDAGEQFIA
jgi:hypothetical protein